MSQSKTKFWIVLAVIVIIVLAAVYYYYAYKTPADDLDSNDVSSIESDLGVLPIEGLDSELSDIEKEL